MTRRHRRVAIALGIAGVAAAAIGIGAKTLLPRLLRGALERLATQALGRDLEIAGPLRVSRSLAPRVTAGDVRLANAAWGSEPSMARAGHVTMVVDLVSLWRGPVRVRDLEIRDARLLLEASRDGRGNWVVGSEPASSRPPEPTKRPPVVLDRAAIVGLELVYRPRPEAAAVTLGVRELEARLDPATRMVGVRGGGRLDQTPWEISGRLGTFEQLYQGHEVEHDLAARIGASRLESRGRVGDLLALGAPDLELGMEGPDIAAALETFGLRSPLTGAFHLAGRLKPAPDGVDVDVRAAVGTVAATARGVVAAPLSLEAFRLAVEAAGPDASLAGSWLGLPGLPARPFGLAARVLRQEGRLHLEDGRARLGPTSLVFSGVVGAPPSLVGTDLGIRATGEDLSSLSKLTRLRLPPGPFQAAGRILRRPDGIAVRGVELRFRDAVIRAEGTLGQPPQLATPDLTVDASGPDLSAFSRIATVELPPVPFALRGRIARDGNALRLDAVEGRLGDDAVSVSGRLALAARLEGTAVEVRLAGPDLARLASRAGLRGAPAQPYQLRGGVRVVPGGYELEGVAGSAGRVSAALEGRIGAAAGLDGTSLACRAHGPALADLAAWGLPGGLPADPFSVEGRLRIEEGLYRAEGVVAKVGPDRAGVDGALGVLPDLSRLDVAVEAQGPSLAGLGRFLVAAGLEAPERVPDAAYEVSGRVRRVPQGYELRDLRAKVNETMVRVAGTVGAARGLAGSELRIEASGPDLAAALGPVAWAGRVPAAPFEISAELAGSVERFAASRLAARLGGSDLEGSLSVRLGGKPVLDADLRSGRLEVAELLAGSGARPGGGAAPREPAKAAGDRLISDHPLDLGALQAVDATLKLEVAALPVPGVPLREVLVAGELRDGALRLDRLAGTGVHGGRATASLALEPSGSGYRLATRGRLDGARLFVSGKGASPERAPPFEVEFQLEGKGRSLHDIAASLDGAALVVVGAGEVSNAYERATSGVVVGLLDALNPFRKSSDHTNFECGIAAATVKRGQAAVTPIAARTDKITVVGHGTVDFRTEHVTLEWTTKPRTGVGLSPSLVSNAYVKLGGTLSSPRLEVKPLQAAVATGAAVVTLGLTALAKGLYDRITAEENVCVNELARAKVAVPKPP